MLLSIKLFVTLSLALIVADILASPLQAEQTSDDTYQEKNEVEGEEEEAPDSSQEYIVPYVFDYTKHLPESAWNGSVADGSRVIYTNGGKIRLPLEHKETPPNLTVIFNVYRGEFGCGVKFGKKLMEFEEGDGEFERLMLKEFDFDLDHLIACPFDINKRTVIITSGYLSKGILPWQLELKKQWQLIDPDANVVLIDWTRGANNLMNYNVSVASTHLVARQIVMFLYYMAEIRGVSFESEEFRDNLYFVGHSLGAHISGYAGKELGGRVGRITGLDPAGPTFTNLNVTDHLFRTDAKFVDIIHTNAGEMYKKRKFYYAAWRDFMDKRRKIEFEDVDGSDNAPPLDRQESEVFWGNGRDLGHVDYYVNDGVYQPNCSDFKHFCDHSRAVSIYENILKFEVASRKIVSKVCENHNNNLCYQVQKYKLIAFRADSFQDFRVGTAFSAPQTCLPHLSRRLSDLAINDDNISANNQAPNVMPARCGVTLDVTQSASEFYELYPEIAEFWKDKPVPLKAFPSDATAAPTLRYFFDTLPREPFVGYHFLLRMHLARDDETVGQQDQPGSDEEPLKCKLAIFGANRREKLATGLEIYRFPNKPIDNDKFYGYAVPLNFIFDFSKYRNISASDAPVLPTKPKNSTVLVPSKLMHIFPTVLKMALYENMPYEAKSKNQPTTTNKPNHDAEETTTKAPSSWFWWRTTTPSPGTTTPEPVVDRCARRFKAIELRTISFYNQNISAWYMPIDSKRWSYVNLDQNSEQELINWPPQEMNRMFKKYNLNKILIGAESDRVIDYFLIDKS